MFNLALALACLLNLCDCPVLFLTAPVVEGVPKTKGHLSQNLEFRLIGSQTPRQQVLKCKYIQFCETKV